MADAKSKKQKTAETTGNAEKETAPKEEKATDLPPNDWAQTVLNQLIEAQKTWFENAAQQNALLIETVNKMSAMKETAPTEALSEWIKQGIQGFVETQKRWSEIAVQQSEQILQAVQSNTDFSKFNEETTGKNASQAIESLVKMRNSWLDFVNKQNTQLINAMKDTLKIDESSPASAMVDFAQKAVNNYVEVQKRWLDLAMQIPFSGSKDDFKK